MESTRSWQSYRKIWKYVYNYCSIHTQYHKFYCIGYKTQRHKKFPKLGHYIITCGYKCFQKTEYLVLAFPFPKELLSIIMRFRLNQDRMSMDLMTKYFCVWLIWSLAWRFGMLIPQVNWILKERWVVMYSIYCMNKPFRVKRTWKLIKLSF